MINNLLSNDYSVSVISDEQYKKYATFEEKQIKGKSKYENYTLIEYLPKNKEFYVICDETRSYDATFEWDFAIATKYKGICFVLTDSGSN